MRPSYLEAEFRCLLRSASGPALMSVQKITTIFDHRAFAIFYGRSRRLLKPGSIDVFFV